MTCTGAEVGGGGIPRTHFSIFVHPAQYTELLSKKETLPSIPQVLRELKSFNRTESEHEFEPTKLLCPSTIHSNYVFLIQ